ncbi:MAG: AmmeMemoRadiSam system protein B [Holophaga sp.]|nr:AmmeMemoRadiSam system protein B [Holophaga sp.]
MPLLRQPVVAGLFYPADPVRLRELVQGLLREAPAAGAPPKAIIAPHAGYVYSGAVAARGHACLGLGRARIRRVVLLGPSHRVAFRGLAASSATGFATPLGTVPVDAQGVEQALGLDCVRRFDPAHAQEHSLEVQLPFLQEALDDFQLVPLVVGEADPAEVAAVLERMWGGPETAIVVSSDLSHYQDYGAAQRIDQATAAAIVALRPEAIGMEAACGALPVRGLLLAARGHGLGAWALDVRNSGDTAGDRDRVVGYGAFAFA